MAESFSLALTENLNKVSAALPEGFNITRFVQNGVALLNGNKILQDFARQNGTSQIQQGMLQGAYLGLDFMNKEAYLVPYGSTLNFMKSYTGAIKLAKKYSTRPIKNIYAKVVRQGDEFSENIVNGNQMVNFSPLPFNCAPIVGAFAVCQFEDGTCLVDTMSLEAMNVSRSKSRAANSMAWKDFPEEMYKKTVLHRLCKTIDLDMTAEQREAYESGEEIETDTRKQVENEVNINANTEEFNAGFEVVE